MSLKAFHCLPLPRASRNLPCCSVSAEKDRAHSPSFLSPVKGLPGSRRRGAELTGGQWVNFRSKIGGNRKGPGTGAAQGDACGGKMSGFGGQPKPNQRECPGPPAVRILRGLTSMCVTAGLWTKNAERTAQLLTVK